ncbi:hypothetical protein D3C71_79490 [compost metagenome]
MEFEKTSLFRETMTIVQSGEKPVHFLWEADIHAGGQTIRALKVLQIDTQRDFENAYGDTVIVRLAILGGTYAFRIYPNQSKLDITLHRIPIGETNSFPNPDAKRQTERYTAVLVDRGNPTLEGNSPSTGDEEALNQTNLFEIEFQLSNKAMEQIRMMTVGGIYRGSTNEDVIKYVLTNACAAVKVDGARTPKGVDMVKASNGAERAHIVIPQGTAVVDLPNYVHNKCGGVYSTGMGYYMQGDYWYVYPCYDSKRFNEAPKTLTVINVPKNKFPDAPRTYRKDGRNTIILATGEVSFKDFSDARQLNEGNGVRFADADNFMGTGFAVTKNNRTTMSRGDNVSEFVSTQRDNGMNNVKFSRNKITSNSFVEYSNMAQRDGSYISLLWVNALPELIFPGMPARVLYLDKGEIREIYGVVLKAFDATQLVGAGITADRHGTTVALSIFVQRSPAAK